MPRHALKRTTRKVGSTCVTRKGASGKITKIGTCYPKKSSTERYGFKKADLEAQLISMGVKVRPGSKKATLIQKYRKHHNMKRIPKAKTNFRGSPVY
jgi:hypothetical protein